MGFDNYKGTEVAESGQETYTVDKQFSAIDEELQPSLNSVLSSIDYELCEKHPLEHTWTLWHWQSDRKKCWEEMLSNVTSFNTVEDFFSVHYFIKPPSDLKAFNDYMVFKHDIRPMWEDVKNRKGGRWIFFLNRESKELVDNMWHDLLLCTLGESFEYPFQICGVVVNVRNKAAKISLWTKDSLNQHAILAIGRKIKEVLQLCEGQLQYQVHSDAMIHTGPNCNALYKL
ncbi:eukaryotic translation initiation factor 4E1 [Drosophila grimshawi]|uniref:eukaryotic translation initiation factor 4E1 n=1 Tax=Drosophila grimshawi TaxID=7222 RepID=UPI001C93252F|nr:eukaryotic translation initiation factor 4E1 [Drosophila grimshawi]